MTSVAESNNSPENQDAAPLVELPPSLLYDRRFLFNREASWLEFNRRVLAEAQSSAHPVLERLKFLSIFSTNLDEFFMIRVSALKEQIEDEVTELSPDGMTAREQVREIRARLQPLVDEQMRVLHEEVLPALTKENVIIWDYDALGKREKERANYYFAENVFPVLTPQAVDASHPFPYISNLSLNLGVVLKSEEGKKAKVNDFQSRFARIKLPTNVPRLIPVNDANTQFTPLGQLIKANTALLFPGMKISQAHLFRVTRDADIELREDEAGDLLRSMERELRRRRFGSAVRVEVSSAMPDDMVDFLSESIGLEETDVYRVQGFLNVPDLMTLYKLDLPALKDRPLLPVTPTPFRRHETIFETVRARDVLFHHPFTNFNAVVDFIDEAADDDDVQAIKICLYRTGKDSPIVKSLIKAAQNGKQVAALVELKARFDEENNIEWARALEREGVHVVYGLRGLKTHSKLALVIRREAGRLRRYVHIATGNYNPSTAKLYTDLGLLTVNEEIGADATDIFNYLTGFSNQSEFKHLSVAPINLREKIISLIEREARHGKKGRIIAKMNSLTDVEIVRALYVAAQRGVSIDLIVRGICVLRPGVAGLSESVRVTSVVGRFLEHSRIFYFADGNNDEDGKQGEIYIGSADWMQRNLNRRVEVVAPILSGRLRHYIKNEILNVYLRDNTNARRLQPDGNYEPVTLADGETPFSAQNHFVGKNT